MGKDKRVWRKLVKKLRRKKKRQILAHQSAELLPDDSADEHEDSSQVNVKESEATDKESLHGNEFFLSASEWSERERQAELCSVMKLIETERLAHIEAENQRKIREEWEAKQENERKLMEEKERLEKQMKEKQETEFNDFLGFLSGDIETPPTKYLLPAAIPDDENVCYYFARTATCRFYERCTKSHPRPTLSTAILIPNFFSHFKLEQCTRDEYDSDLGLEYEDNELYKEFIDFYEDVVPELRQYGTLVQFKVCCNLEPHLRGNVYVQYRTIKESVEAYRKFNGRFYNGKQLSLQFIKMDSWRSAICGSFLRKACVKGRICNYLHVFRNPTKEFVRADHDWKETPSIRASPFQAVIQSTNSISGIQAVPPKIHESLPVIEKDQSKCRNQIDINVVTEERVTNLNDSNTSNKTPSRSHKRKRSRSLTTDAKQRKKRKKNKKKLKKIKKSKKHRKKKRSKNE